MRNAQGVMRNDNDKSLDLVPSQSSNTTGKDFRWTKAYPKRELIYIDQEVPVIEIYPNFRRDDWKNYFLYYENSQAQSDDTALATDIYFVEGKWEKGNGKREK